MPFDAIVIGSGFGGAVAACRLAQAGLSVCIIERGRRYSAGSFPRDYTRIDAGWSYGHGQGLFDVRPLASGLMAVESAGYGGGSLVYANVIMRAPADLFQHGWPAGINRASLDPYYDLVGYMLDIKPIAASQPKGLPPKTLALRHTAQQLGRSAQLFHPNLAVDFSDPGVPHHNRFGMTQRGCTHCGECDVGCNLHAKNTLDLNYLALAERHQAHVKTRCEVTCITPHGDGYRVHFRDFAGAETGYEDARQVFLCAGAVSSTELLLRCRDTHKTLPNVSARLGFGYSGNGDFLGMVFDSQHHIEPTNGPTITGAILYDHTEGQRRHWFLLEDGSAPRELARIAELLSPKLSWLKSGGELLWSELRASLAQVAAASAHTSHEPSEKNALFLVMGRDDASGRLHLDPLSGALRLDWNVPANLPLYQAEERLVSDVAKSLGGTPVYNPLWSRLHQPAATHNLGGCGMAETPELGVTSPIGEVFGHPNLYVLDGAIMPVALGTNPSATIAAVAERSIESIIRRIKNDSTWSAPERRHATHIAEPLDAVLLPAGKSTPPPETPAIGVHFTETMRGFGVRGFAEPLDYRAAEIAGQRAGSQMRFTLTITMPDLASFLADSNKTAIAVGTVHVDGFTGPQGAQVRDGIFNMFVHTESVAARRMLYALPFFGEDGKPYLLDGWKDVRDHGHFDVWESTTTLYTVIRAGHSRSGEIVGTGIIHVHRADFLEQLTTIRVTGTDHAIERSEAYAQFGKSFFGPLWEVFVLPRLPHLFTSQKK